MDDKGSPKKILKWLSSLHRGEWRQQSKIKRNSASNKIKARQQTRKKRNPFYEVFEGRVGFGIVCVDLQQLTK